MSEPMTDPMCFLRTLVFDIGRLGINYTCGMDTSRHHNWMRPRPPNDDDDRATQVPENKVGRVENVYGLLHVCLHLI